MILRRFSLLVISFVLVANLSSADAQKWLAHNQKIHSKFIAPGSLVDFDCRLSNSSLPVFLTRKVSKNKQTDVTVDGSKVVQVGQMFTIYNFNTNDNGDYKCETLMPNGRRTALTIGKHTAIRAMAMLSPPTIDVIPIKLKLLEGNDAVLTCRSTLNVNTKFKSIKWYKNIQPLSERFQNYSYKGQVYTKTLKFSDLDTDESEIYECRTCLYHQLSSIRACWSAKAELIVEEFKFLSKGPSFFVGDIGSSATIDCETSDFNSTTILMRQDNNGVLIKVIPDGSKIVRKGGKFVINNINLKDGSKYMCKSTSVTQRIISKPVGTLVVLQGGNSNPKAYLKPSSKSLFLGESFNFSCHAFGDAIVFTWLKNNQSVPAGMVSSLPTRPHQGYTHFVSILTIKKAQKSNAGTYKCRISSSRQPGYSNDATAIVRIIECRKPNGLFPDPFNRRGYILCKNNIATRQTCPSPAYWDDQRKQCVVPPTTPTPSFLKWLHTGTKFMKQLPMNVSYEFDCRLSIPTVKVTLLKEDVIVPIDGTKVEQSGQKFTINNLNEYDPALYKCRADGIADLEFDIYVERQLSTKLSIRMYPPPFKLLELESTDNYTIQCKSLYSGSTSWYKLDPTTNAWRLIEKGVLRFDTNAGHSLKTIWTLNLRSVTAMDSGIYKCRKNNSYGVVAEESIKVFVKAPVKPDILTTGNSTLEVTQSKSLKIILIVTGSPSPTVTLTNKDGVTLITCHGGQTLICTSTFSRRKRRYSGTWGGKVGNRSLTITISKVSFLKHNGIMSILAKNLKGEKELKLNVVVNVRPSFVKTEELQFADEDTERKLTCKIKEARPSAKLEWSYQPWACDSPYHLACNSSKHWQPVDPKKVIWSKDSQESTLTVPASKEFAFFRCSASNKVGQADLVYRLLRTEKLNDKLKITQGSSLTASKGETVTITCKAKVRYVNPPYWIDANGKEVSNSSRVLVTKKLGRKADITTITISNTSLGDSGIYTCMALKKKNVPISVFIRLNIMEITSPVVTFESQTVNESSHVTLNCTVSGYPLPTVQWYKNDDLISTHHSLQSLDDCASRKRNVYYYLENLSPIEPGKARTRTVVICHADYKDTGLYMCLATNKGGDVNKTAYLDVLAKPKIDLIHTKQSWVEGDDVIVNCKATGNPTPEVRWLKESVDGTFVPYKDSTWSKNNTYLIIKDLSKDDFAAYKCEARNKMGDTERDFSVGQTPVINKYTVSKNKETLSNTAKIVLGIVGGFSFIIVLVVIAVLYRRKKLYGGFYILTLPPMPDYLKKLDPHRPIQEQTNRLPLCADWEFPRNRLTLGKVIGSGAFGQVFKADAVGIVAFDPRSSIKGKGRRRSRFGSTRSHYYSNRQVTVVACKGLKEDASESEYKDLVSELKILMHIGEHKNIVNLLGACTKGRECEVLVIIEFCPHGNLLEFLRNRRDIFQATWAPATERPDESLSTKDLVITAFQVARAMEFLATRRCVHRDLAARNVLVGENYVMKVADFGLARDIYNEDHYVKRTSGLLPVKWMAIEALVDRVYTHQSDVWSFGVLLWEIFTLGGSPYPGLPANEVYQYLMEGQRMHQPEDSPDQMYHLMQACWKHDPNDRPVFSSIVQTIDKLLEGTTTQTGEEYLELENEIDPRENQPYYLQPEEIASFQRPPESPSSPFDNLHSPLPPLPQDEIELQQLIRRSDSDDHNSNTRDFILQDVPKGKKKKNFEFDHELEQQKKSDSSGIVSDEEGSHSEDEHLMKDYVFDPPSPYVNSKPYNYSNEVQLPKKGKDGRKESARYV